MDVSLIVSFLKVISECIECCSQSMSSTSAPNTNIEGDVRREGNGGREERVAANFMSDQESSPPPQQAVSTVCNAWMRLGYY